MEKKRLVVVARRGVSPLASLLVAVVARHDARSRGGPRRQVGDHPASAVDVHRGALGGRGRGALRGGGVRARIFGRLHDIRNILAGITYSLVPVSNAFAILGLVMCVYAIVGVQLFHEQQKDAFGNFGVALYTIFAASTMDGWQELVVIPFISEEEAGLSNSVPQNGMLIAFFVSFFLIVGWTLLPVVVAILLENFSYSTHAQQAKEDREHQAKAGYLNKIQHCLDPLLEVLALRLLLVGACKQFGLEVCHLLLDLPGLLRVRLCLVMCRGLSHLRSPLMSRTSPA